MKRAVFSRIFGKRKKTIHERYPQYEIGRGTYGDLTVRSWREGATLRIGSFCSIASGVQIFLGGEHRTDWVTTYPFSALWEKAGQIKGHPRSKGDVTIGSDVWIGSEAVIMSGVRVGDGAVIAARSVVTADVAPYVVVGGNPARVIRQRFDDETVRRLLAIRWWEWDDGKIERYLPLLLSNRIDAFLEVAEREDESFAGQKNLLRERPKE